MSHNNAEKFSYEQSHEFLPEPSFVKKRSRWVPLDIARGLAIVLMILSHTVKGLLAESMIPDWGMVPVHLLTKFSSSLFIIVFGVAVSLYFLPLVHKPNWPDKRLWMIKRGFELLIWYKLLTVVQMFQFYSTPMIIETLLYQRMPDFVEILSFYSIALMWLPFALPMWSRRGFFTKVFLIGGLFLTGQWLHHNFDFWGIDSLKAILVEQEGFHTFGQFQRGALVLLGLLLGDIYLKMKDVRTLRRLMPLSCLALGVASLTYFYLTNSNDISFALLQVSKNVGKRPMELAFMSFSLGGALTALGLCLLMSSKIQKWMKPLAYIGQYSLSAFCLHIIIIFYFYRYVFDLHHKVTYLQSLGLAALCVGLILILLKIWSMAKGDQH